MILVFLLISNVQATNPARTLENNKAVNLINKDQTLEAQSQLQRSVVNHNNYSELHYNLAISYEKNGEVDKAVKEYELAAKMTDSEVMKFQANFNAAHLLGENKKIQDALARYQAALEVKPSSVEVKTNIELLTKENSGGQSDKQDQSKKNDKSDKQEQNKKNEQGQNQQNQDNQQQQKPKENKLQEYKSENLSKQDVQKIFEELKRQEDKIRAKVNDEKKTKDKAIEKDW